MLSKAQKPQDSRWEQFDTYQCAPVAPYTQQWTVMNLHGQINAARPGRSQPCHWSVWSVAFMLSYKMDFSSCDIMANPVK